MAITLRQESATGATTKGSALTFAELDNNFIDVLQNKIQPLQVDADTGSVTVGEAQSNGVLTLIGGTNVTTSVVEDSAGNASITIDATDSVGISNVVEDTTPQLGGDLDINTNSIVSTANGDITLAPNGTGDVILGTLTFDGDQTVGAGQDNYVLTYDNGTGKISLEAAAAGGISNVVEDTTPQLGGALDGQDNVVSAVELKDYKETVYDLGTTDTPTLTVSNGNVQTVTITSGLTLPEFSDAQPGHTITLLVSGTGSVSGSTSSAGNEYLFAGGNKTLTNDSIISIVFDGGNYLASVATDFQA
jgi:hypothetical protein